MLFSSDDELTQPSARLITLAQQLIETTRGLRLDALQSRVGGPEDFFNLWPGEHHRLLAGLVMVCRPQLVIEIGTGSGCSALAMKHTLPSEGQIVTFDIVPWQRAPEGLLRESDFQDGRLAQYTDDLTWQEGFEMHRGLFERADLIFIDAAKDGRMEERLVKTLRMVAFRTRPVFVFDDIRLWNMLKIWRELPWPKLDFTSFGHWTGTGLVEWQP